MSLVGMNRNNTDTLRAGRLFAVLSILFAALVMQFVVSAQGLSARFSSDPKAGSVSFPQSVPSDQVVSRHAIRATPAADLRFTTERPEGKSVPGGPDPFATSGHRLVVPARLGRRVGVHARQAVVIAAVGHHTRVRAPPAMRA